VKSCLVTEPGSRRTLHVDHGAELGTPVNFDDPQWRENGRVLGSNDLLILGYMQFLVPSMLDIVSANCAGTPDDVRWWRPLRSTERLANATLPSSNALRALDTRLGNILPFRLAGIPIEPIVC
jgi:hypothetical protein